MNSIDDLLTNDGLIAPRTAVLQRRLRRLAERGLVVRLFPGVYAATGRAGEVETRIRAAALWSGDGVLTGSAAARVTFPPELPVTTISITGRADRNPPPGISRCRHRLPPSMIIEHRRQVLQDSRDEPWSAAERMQRQILLRRAKITGWRTNVEVWCGPRHCFIDVAFRGSRVAIEVDGYEVHSQRAQFERDRQKWSDLTAAGWLGLHFTWHQLTEQPDWVIATIRATLRLRR